MIPKKIHYIWLSGDPFPESIQLIQKLWRKTFVDYEFKLWDKSEYDKIPDKPQYIIDAYNQKKWAFVSDYIRVYALFTEGGWYFDSDLQMFTGDLEQYRSYSFVSTVEVSGNFFDLSGYYWRTHIQAAWMGAQPGNILLKDIIEYYKKAQFIFKDNRTKIAPEIYGDLAIKYGFDRSIKKEQQLLQHNMILLDYKKIIPYHRWEMHLTEQDVPLGIHHCFHGWTNHIFGLQVQEVLNKANKYDSK